jgi:hypothetical protein
MSQSQLKCVEHYSQYILQQACMGDRFQNRNDGVLFTVKLPQPYVGQCNKTSVSAPPVSSPTARCLTYDPRCFAIFPKYTVTGQS